MVQWKSRRRNPLRMLVPLLAVCNLVWIGLFLTRFETKEKELISPSFKPEAENSEQRDYWHSALRDFEKSGTEKRLLTLQGESSQDSAELGYRIGKLRDELRTAVVSAAGTAHTDSNGRKIRHNFAKPPPDQPIEFFVPFLSPPKITAINPTTIILVPSHQGSFVKRQAIRETWKSVADRTVVLFVVAHSDCQQFNLDLGIDSIASKAATCDQVDHNFLKLEQETNHDLLEIPMREDYHRISEKILQAYNWALKNVPNLKWIAKADDDMFVNVQNLEHYVKNYNSEIPVVIGEIIYNSFVAKEGKWADLDYPNTYYPNWPKGSAGHVLSRATVEYIVQNSESLHRYQGEDTNIGIWLDEATRTGRLKDVTYINSPEYFISSGKSECESSPTAIMIGHELSPDDQAQCLKNSRNMTDSEKSNSWRGLSTDIERKPISNMMKTAAKKKVTEKNTTEKKTATKKTTEKKRTIRRKKV